MNTQCVKGFLSDIQPQYKSRLFGSQYIKKASDAYLISRIEYGEHHHHYK